MKRSKRCLTWLSFVVVLTMFAGIGLGDSRGEKSKPPKRKSKPHFKGVELYATYVAERKEWRFGWLPGTNRLKTAEEVKKSLNIVGVKALKKELAKFAEKEHVFLIENQSPRKPNGIDLTAPNKKTLKELQAYCKARQIKFYGPGLAEE